MLDYILDNGADVNIQGNNKQNSLDLAIDKSNKDRIISLLNKGGKLSSYGKQYRDSLIKESDNLNVFFYKVIKNKGSVRRSCP